MKRSCKEISRSDNRSSGRALCRVRQMSGKCSTRGGIAKTWALLSLLGCSSLALAGAMLASTGEAVALDEQSDRADFSISIDLSLNLTLSETNLSIPIKPTATGQFGRTNTTVGVSTNNTTGYVLTMQSNADTLTNRDKPDYFIGPVEATTTACANETDTTCDTFPLDKWGYRVGDSGPYSSITSVIDTPLVLSESHSNTGDHVDSTTLYFATKLDSKTPAGIYDGVKLTFTATSNVTSASALIKPDTANGITKVTLNDKECTDDAGCLVEGLTPWGSYDLIAEVAEGYTFSVWNVDGKGEVTDPTATSTQFTVGNGDATITASGKDMRIYMQNMTLAQCDGTSDKPLTVIDSRDGQEYQVAKLTDNNGKTMCWMLDNLALGAKPLSDGVIISAENTNNPNTAKFNNSSLTNNTANFASTTANYENPYINTDSSNTVTSGQTWKYGVYYNYCAASAGTMCVGTSSTTTSASGDICPKSWRMPTGGDGGEYRALYQKYNSYASLSTALHLPLSGYFSSGSPKYQGAQGGSDQHGFFWSRTRYSNGSLNMYRLDINGTSLTVSSTSNGVRSNGFSVRCVIES